MHGKSVTLYLDCQKIETQRLRRGDDAAVSTDGVTVFGTRLLDKAVFEVGSFNWSRLRIQYKIHELAV